MDRFETENQRVEAEVESHNSFFRRHTEKMTCRQTTFTGTQGHRIMEKAKEGLIKNGYKVSSSTPEYDGMVKWAVEITEKVKL